MYLMGQALFSAALVQRFRPRSVRAIALCTADDSELHPLLDVFPEVEVVVIHSSEVGASAPSPDVQDSVQRRPTRGAAADL
jgi:hypothetical protein